MRYTFVKQHDATDCAAACLAMVCLHYKKETTITKLRDLMGTDIKGTNLIGLSKCADELGFNSQAVFVDADGFVSEYTKPCIANIITDEGLSHFVVVFKVTKRYVIVGDPGEELKKVKINDFLEHFTGALLLLKPDSRFENEKKEKSIVFSRFLRLLLNQKKLFVYSIVASLLITILGIVSSVFNKIIMDEVLPYKLKSMLLVLLIIFAVVGITRILLQFVRGWIMIYLSQRIDIPLMLGYFRHIYRLPMKFFATRRTGDIITRFSDAFTIKEIFTNIALTLFMDLSMALVTGIILFNMIPGLFAIIFLLTMVSAIVVLCFRQPYKKINMEQMQQMSILNSEIIEGLEGVETIKCSAGENAELEALEKEYIKSLRITMKEGMMSNAQENIVDFISTAMNLLVLYFGISEVINGQITLGLLMAFLTLSEFFMEPIERLVKLQLDIQEANVSMKRMAEILEYEQEQSEKTNLKPFPKRIDKIEFSDITFRYGNRKPALNNISFSINKGEKVAIVGASGSGKTTIAKLLLKYYDPEKGEIKCNGINLKDIENRSLRAGISYVPQNIQLFSKSIFENISIVNPDADEEEVEKVAKKAGAHDFIQKLPLQYYTFLEESGEGLSGGEKQRLAIARALLQDGDFYILDESTSNLDYGTEKILFDMIFDEYKDRTILIIAHRLSSIKHCDKILLLDEGEIAEQGTHGDLLKQKGKYYELWEMQQGNFH